MPDSSLQNSKPRQTPKPTKKIMTTATKTPATKTAKKTPPKASNKAGKAASAAADKKGGSSKVRSFSDPTKTVDGAPLDGASLAADAKAATGGEPSKAKGKGGRNGKKSAPVDPAAIDAKLVLVDYVPKSFDEASTAFNRICRMLPGGIGLEIAGDFTIEEAADSLSFMLRMGNTIQFCIGDLLCASELKFGESYAQIVDATGFAISTVGNAQWVSSRIPKERRVAGLFFSHHKAVASLEDKDQDKLLVKAAKDKLSSKDLEKLVKEIKNPTPAASTASTVGQIPAASTTTGETTSTPAIPDGKQTGAGVVITGQPHETDEDAKKEALLKKNDLAMEAADKVIDFLKSEAFQELRPLQRKGWKNIASQISGLVSDKQ